MFRKLVSGLPYSPALVGNLGFYARRLKKEDATRRLGLVFIALALVVQSFTVFSPPEAANASNNSDMIRGGVSNKADILAAYDQSARGKGDFKDIMDYAGITRKELTQLQARNVNSKQFGTGNNAMLTWGREHRFSSSKGEVKHVIPRSNGGSSNLYAKPLWLYDSTSYTKKNGSTYQAFVGHSAKIGWFAIHKDCGNLLTTKHPKPHPNGKLLKATCDVVTGFAYDARQLDEKVKVYLYFNGPPGKGDKVGPVVANNKEPSSPKGKGYGFSVKVPQKYRTAKKSTKVYGVMVPLKGWHESTVPIGNDTIPGNCVKPEPKPKPTAECSALKLRIISRTKFALTARASTDHGATVKGYTFTVKDKAGKVVFKKDVNSNKTTAESGTFELKDAGNYSSAVVVHTSKGDKSGGDCEKVLRVATQPQCKYNPDLPVNHPDCKPCPGNEEIWIKDAECAPNVVQGKEVSNLSQNLDDADGTTAKNGERLQYTIFVENTGSLPATTSLREELGDVLEYASLVDEGNGLFDDTSKVLSWGDINLKPGEKQTRSFVVKVNASTPATPRGTSEPGSFDCVMNNVFGNSVSVNVDCPAVKGVEQTVSELPKTGTGANIVFGTAVIMVATYLYARARQMKKEVRLIRHDFNSGTLN